MKRIAIALVLAACSHGHASGPGDDDSIDAGADIDAPGGTPDSSLPTSNDPFPTGAISLYLATDCPSGWKAYDDAAGRTLIAQVADPHTAVGMPLARNETRAHHHDASVGVDFPTVSYVGVAGSGNDSLTPGGHFAASIATADGDAVLPYVQFLACKKVAAPGAARVPSGLLAYYDAPACPSGWSPAPDAIVGRIAIGVPTGGTPGQTFGGAPLTSGEVRTHTHAISSTLAAAGHGIALLSGCCGGGYGASGDRALTGATSPSTVDLPYLQLRGCTKD